MSLFLNVGPAGGEVNAMADVCLRQGLGGISCLILPGGSVRDARKRFHETIPPENTPKNVAMGVWSWCHGRRPTVENWGRKVVGGRGGGRSRLTWGSASADNKRDIKKRSLDENNSTYSRF
jgi:hypothetical protein